MGSALMGSLHLPLFMCSLLYYCVVIIFLFVLFVFICHLCLYRCYVCLFVCLLLLMCFVLYVVRSVYLYVFFVCKPCCCLTGGLVGYSRVNLQSD